MKVGDKYKHRVSKTEYTVKTWGDFKVMLIGPTKEEIPVSHTVFQSMYEKVK